MKYLLAILLLTITVHAQRKTDSPAEEDLRSRMQALLEAEVAEIAAGPVETEELDESGKKIKVPGRTRFSSIRPTWWGHQDDLLVSKGLKGRLNAGNFGMRVVPYKGPRGVGGIAYYYRVRLGQVEVKEVHFGPEVERAKPDVWRIVTDADGKPYASLEAMRPTPPVNVPDEPAPVEPDPEPNETITPTE